MLNHFLENLLVFVFIFYFYIFSIVTYGKYGKILKACKAEVNSPIWVKF